MELMGWLASLPADNSVALECGAGKGELAQYFTRKFQTAGALDVKPYSSPNLCNPCFVESSADDLPFENNSIDLITSMQSLHHFDVQKHICEAERVLRKGGIFAALCWGHIQLPNWVEVAYREFFAAIAPYWECERPWVLSGYEGLVFKGEALNLPATMMTRHVSMGELELEFVRWGATQKAVAHGTDLPDPMLDNLGFEAPQLIEISWPVLGKIFRV